MEFHEYLTSYDAFKRSFRRSGEPLPSFGRDADTFYKAHMMKAMETFSQTGLVAVNQWLAESRWEKDKRPYYQVWPGIIEPLSRLKLVDVPAVDVELTPDIVCFRFAKQDKNFRIDDQYQLRSMLVVDGVEAKVEQKFELVKTGETRRTFTLWMDWGETESNGTVELPVLTFQRLLMKPGYNLEQAADAMPTDDSIDEGIRIPPELLTKAVRLACAVALLARDREEGLIEPDVLSKDLAKWRATGNKAIVERAHRRGKIGWNVGRNIEVSPHYRRAHPMVLKAGVAGRTKSRIVWRKDTFVHRDKIKKLPTDREGEK